MRCGRVSRLDLSKSALEHTIGRRAQTLQRAALNAFINKHAAMSKEGRLPVWTESFHIRLFGFLAHQWREKHLVMLDQISQKQRRVIGEHE